MFIVELSPKYFLFIEEAMADHTYTENEQSEGELVLFLDVSFIPF